MHTSLCLAEITVNVCNFFFLLQIHVHNAHTGKKSSAGMCADQPWRIFSALSFIGSCEETESRRRISL